MNPLDQYMMQQYAQQQTPQQNPMGFWQSLFGGPPQAPQTGKPNMQLAGMGMNMMKPPAEQAGDAPAPFTPQQKPPAPQTNVVMSPYFGGPPPMASQMQRPPVDPRMMRRR